MNRIICFVVAIVASGSRAIAADVPFVGCKSDGQTGPRDAPQGTSKAAAISAEAAQRLAYYKAEIGFGALAPRGWHCFGTYGSNGSALYVSPEPIDTAGMFSPSWRGFSGPAIEISDSIGDTSGRFSVAKMIARVFPTHKPFVDRVREDAGGSIESYPLGPYPSDKLTYKSQEIVEYETPPQKEGLGTDSRLRKNDSPIRGVAILIGSTPDLLHLAVRLPGEFADLTSLIIQQAEHE